MTFSFSHSIPALKSSDKVMVFSGSSVPTLAQSISERLGISLGKAKVGHFSDGETMVEILEHVRGRDVFIVQSTSAPCNDHVMELAIMADALRRASAHQITAVIPYFGYARQDRRIRSARVPISAKVVADILASVGITRVVTVDLHAEQIQGFFGMPVDNVYASPALLDDALIHMGTENDSVIVVSPDVGGVVRARAFAKRFQDRDLAIIDKRRPQPNESRVMNIIGDVQNKICLLIDDMIDTAGTLTQAAVALKEHGASRIVAYGTHAVFSGPAIQRIEASPIDEVVVTDTIPLRTDALNCSKIRVLSLASLLAEAIRRITEEESLSLMFSE